MKLALLLLIFALFGCTQPQVQNNTAPAVPLQNVTQNNITQPSQPNITTPSPPAVSSGNLTIPAPQNTTPQNQTPMNASNTTTKQNVSIPAGLLFGDGAYSLVLDDVSVIPTSQQPCGIFSMRNASDGSIIDKTLLCPGEDQDWVAPDGHMYRILVIQVAAGYTKSAEWAKVDIYG